MASEMGCKNAVVLLLFFLLGEVTCKVEVTGFWKQESGWEVTCSWQTLINDTLQSVRLYRNGVQYEIFRPEKDGLHLNKEMPSPQFHMTVDCRIPTPAGQRGRCITSVYLLQPPTEDIYVCEMSGEGPKFLEEERAFSAFVIPSSAEVAVISRQDSGQQFRRTLNCTSTGVPAPKLKWTVGDQTIPQDFDSARWNETTKLWHSWSTYTPQSSQRVTVTCTPQVATKEGILLEGKVAEYVNSTHRIGASIIVAVIQVLLALLR